MFERCTGDDAIFKSIEEDDITAIFHYIRSGKPLGITAPTYITGVGRVNLIQAAALCGSKNACFFLLQLNLPTTNVLRYATGMNKYDFVRIFTSLDMLNKFPLLLQERDIGELLCHTLFHGQEDLFMHFFSDPLREKYSFLNTLDLVWLMKKAMEYNKLEAVQMLLRPEVSSKCFYREEWLAFILEHAFSYSIPIAKYFFSEDCNDNIISWNLDEYLANEPVLRSYLLNEAIISGDVELLSLLLKHYTQDELSKDILESDSSLAKERFVNAFWWAVDKNHWPMIDAVLYLMRYQLPDCDSTMHGNILLRLCLRAAPMLPEARDTALFLIGWIQSLDPTFKLDLILSESPRLEHLVGTDLTKELAGIEYLKEFRKPFSKRNLELYAAHKNSSHLFATLPKELLDHIVYLSTPGASMPAFSSRTAPQPFTLRDTEMPETIKNLDAETVPESLKRARHV